MAAPSPVRVVMMVTPVTKDPSAVRRALAGSAVGAGTCLSGDFGEVMAPVYCFSYFMSNGRNWRLCDMLDGVRWGRPGAILAHAGLLAFGRIAGAWMDLDVTAWRIALI